MIQRAYATPETPELLKRNGIKITIVEGQVRARVSNISPIHSMYDRGTISLPQFSAAQKLYECWVTAWGERHSCEVRERISGGFASKEITTSQINAMRQCNKARKAAGNEWDLIDAVVIQEMPLGRKKTNGWERGQLIRRFTCTLDKIAKVYGYL